MESDREVEDDFFVVSWSDNGIESDMNTDGVLLTVSWSDNGIASDRDLVSDCFIVS